MTKPSAATLKLKDYLLKDRPTLVPGTYQLERQFGLQRIQVVRQLQSAGYVKDKASPAWHADPASSRDYEAVVFVDKGMLTKLRQGKLANDYPDLKAKMHECAVLLATLMESAESTNLRITREGFKRNA